MRIRQGFIPCAGRPARRSLDCEIRGIVKRGYLSLPVAVLLTIPAWPQQKPADLAEKSIEDLMNMEVTSVSKKEQKMSRAASAIFVITQDDIRHSGATNIPDLLRMVPRMDVAQISANTWAISARGFNEQFSDKLLVLIDGRTVYSPLNSGVNWDTQDILLEDIERIEVIRGPGATVWGANAVNGVINITTKKAADTHGGLVTGGGGTHEQGFGGIRYGGSINSHTGYRIFGKYFDRSHYLDGVGQSGEDRWDMLHGGFRMDGAFSPNDSFTVQGDLYRGSRGEVAPTIGSLASPALQTVDARMDLNGGNILSRWTRTFSSHSEASLQVYFDRFSRQEITVSERRDTVDMELQHHIGWGSRNDLVWGLGYRYTTDGTRGSLRVSFNPESRALNLFSSFVQDEIALQPDRFYLTAGARLEHKDYSGFELEPSVRLAWTPYKRHMVWASFSRAHRTPARDDTALRFTFAVIPGGTPTLLSLLGNPDFKSEDLNALDAGYRTEISNRLSLDIAVFYNRYGSLRTEEPAAPFLESNPPPPHLVIPFIFDNKMHGETHGIELATHWKVTDRWTLNPGYSFLAVHMHLDATSRDFTKPADREGSVPSHQAQLRSHLQLPHNLAWDASAYFVDRLPNQNLPSYTRLDTGITWQPAERVSLSVFGQNLLKDHHFEFNDLEQSGLSSQIKRSVYAKFAWQF